MTDQARRRLAAAQSALLRALVAGEAAPAGFDPERVRIGSAGLLAKRRRGVERHRPDLADTLGPRFAATFGAWATANPLLDGTSAHEDADRFAAFLTARGHLPG